MKWNELTFQKENLASEREWVERTKKRLERALSRAFRLRKPSPGLALRICKHAEKLGWLDLEPWEQEP